jgi:O-antigen/teichoic acid export membrane protein
MSRAASHRPLETQRRLFGNTVLLSASDVVVQSLNFALAITLARSYGPELLGVYAYAMATGALVCILVSLGTHGFVLRRIGREPGQTVVATGALFGFQLSVAIALVLATHLTARALSSSPAIVWIVTLVVAYHCLTRVTSLLVLGFTAREHVGPASALPLARQGVAVLLVIVAVASGAGAPLALAGMPLAAVLVLVGMYAFAARRLGRPELRFQPAEIAWYLREGQPYFFVVLLNTLYGRLGIILLAVLSGEAAVGVYAAAERLVVAVGTVQVMFYMALLPVVTQLWKHDRERFAELTQRASRANLLVTLPVATLIALFAHDIVHLLYADGFADAVPVLVGTAWVLVVRGIAQLLTAVATAADHQRVLARSKSYGLVVLGILGLALMPRFGALGLVAAVLASEIATVVISYVMLRRAGIPTTTLPGGLRVASACLFAASLDWFFSDLSLAFRLPLVVAGGAGALWLFGAVRSHDVRYLRAILAAREPDSRPTGDA